MAALGSAGAIAASVPPTNSLSLLKQVLAAPVPATSRAAHVSPLTQLTLLKQQVLADVGPAAAGKTMFPH